MVELTGMSTSTWKKLCLLQASRCTKFKQVAVSYAKLLKSSVTVSRGKIILIAHSLRSHGAMHKVPFVSGLKFMYRVAA